MNITVVGPGAIGTLLGGLLQRAGHSVTLRGRRPAYAGEEPLRMMLPHGWLMVEGLRWEGPEKPLGQPELILIALARHHLHAVKRPDFLRLIGPGDTPVAFCNVDPQEVDRLAVPTHRRAYLLTLLTAVKLQDGEVELASHQPVLLAERQPTLLAALQPLASQDLRVIPVDDARPYGNSLFLHQLLFLPVAMCNATLESFLSVPEGRELALRVLQEGFSALQRAGLPTARLPSLDPSQLALKLEKRPAEFDAERHRPDRAYNSLLQSYLTSRPTEAAQLNRRIVEIASDAGLHLSWNWRLFQKASRVASVGFYRDPAELMRSLA